MALMDDCIEWLDFCDKLALEMQTTKADDYKMGMGDGLAMAADMFRDYLVEYPDFVDPKLELEKYKM